MKMTFLTLLMLLSANTFAQNCGGLQNGEVVRIDEEGKSLANYRVQDQDGLGSCYANAASLLLQSSLPNNPEVSYLHLATLYKTDNLRDMRESSARSGNFDIYAKKEQNKQKAINGGGGAMEWDLALDGGNTCGVINTVKSMQEKEKKPVLCGRTDLNLEKILTSGDREHRQFKSFLETSLYMNEFQKIFGDLDQKPSLFNKKKILAAQEKYQNFKVSFEGLIAKKRKSIEEQDCNRVNADNIDSLLTPLIQTGLTYKTCFDDPETADDYWCMVANGLAYNRKKNADGAVEIGGVNPEWKKKLKQKIEQRKSDFNQENLSEDIVDSFIESANIPPTKKLMAKQFMKKSIVDKSQGMADNLKVLSDEYNEVAKTGFSKACVKRNVYGYFQTKDFENDWKSTSSLCSYDELMKQATNVIVKYKETGLDDLESAMDFLTTNAGLDYDKAIMALYAADCDQSTKIEIPKNISCNTVQTSWKQKSDTDEIIINKLKSNKPITVSMCAQILKKPKEKFEENECGHHALGVTGVKCEDGKLKYLLQNSWGAQNRASAESGIENVDGKGAYWFSEKDFYDSVYSVDYLN